MANKVKIARSGGANGHTAVIAPSDGNLEYGELGWLNGTNRLFIGRATANPVVDPTEETYEITRTSTATKTGMAGFVATDFDISAFDASDGSGGIVSIKDGAVTNTLLDNSSFTIGSTQMSLGGTTTSFAGLTNLDVTAGDRTWAGSLGANTLTLGGATSTVAIAGDLTVAGTTTTVSSTNLEITDKKIQLGKGAATQAALDDIGIYGDPTTGTDISFLVSDSGTKWTSSHPIVATLEGTSSSTSSLTGLATGTVVGRFDAGTGPHQTKSYADLRSLMISAGTNIGINSSGVISATDTNTWQQVSTSQVGYVAQLPAAHGGKFLKADGSWEVPAYISNTDTWTALSTSAAGYVAQLPAAHGGKFLKADGSWAVPAYTTNTDTWTALSTSAAGYVAILPASHGGKFLKADGSWEVPAYISNTDTWTALSTSAAGYVAQLPASHGGKFLKADGSWEVPAYVANTISNLGVTATGSSYTTTCSDGTNATHSLADTDNWGVMSDEMFDLLAAALQPGDPIDGGTPTWS